jgi:short-subunit dehydrogenase
MPDQKVTVITGASSGIGKALALECAKRGHALALAARNGEQLATVAQQCREQFHADALTVITDVTKEHECKQLIEQTAQRFQRIDTLINNAGISMRALFNDMTLDVMRQVMDINFWGTVYCTKYALPHLLQSRGSVAGVSSVAGYKGLPGRTGYSASKFAMQGFLEALRVENLQNGLHVLIACPGFTASNIRNTALNASGNVQGESPRDESKMMTAEEVARHVMNAVEKRQRTLVLTRQGKLTVLLNKFLPAWMDKQVFNHMRKEPGSPF